MGAVPARCHTGFYSGVVIDRTTLPRIPANVQFEVGQQFVIRGINFDIWPNDLVLGISRDIVLQAQTSKGLMRMVSKTATEIIFTPEYTDSFNYTTTWDVIGNPYLPPRQVLTYGRI